MFTYEQAEEIYKDMKVRYSGKYGMIRMVPHTIDGNVVGYGIEMQ